jgi:hypothetical protein
MSRSPSYILLCDLGIVAASIIVAIFLARTNVLAETLQVSESLGVWGSFFVGIFYTHLFTSIPAAVVLGKIAVTNSILLTAVLGGAGALIGDFVIFKFVRDSISPFLAAHSTRLRNLSTHPFFRWTLILLGALIVASPLPDEPGLVLIGLSQTKTAWFAPLSFLANTVGILVIGLIARSIL